MLSNYAVPSLLREETLKTQTSKYNLNDLERFFVWNLVFYCSISKKENRDCRERRLIKYTPLYLPW